MRNFLSSLSSDRVFLKAATQAVRIWMRTSISVIDIPRGEIKLDE